MSKAANKSSALDQVVSLCKRRGYVFPSGEIYGGTRSAWDYGPLGVELKENIKRQWWKAMVTSREDVVGLDSSVILPTRTWEASGHLSTFTDPLTECLSCHKQRVASVAITQPHSRFQDQQCLDCHGAVAHLPSTMDARDPTECSACHTTTDDPPPQFEHAINLSVSCRSCHQSTEVGSLPVDHSLRADGTCLLCHDYKVAGNPSTNPLETTTSASPGS